MVSQFSSSHNVNLLGQLDFDFPEGTHAIGRLDKDSEGLLLLTTNKRVTRLLFQSKIPHKREYLVQVKNIPDQADLQQLKDGLELEGKGGIAFTTKPAEVSIIDKPAALLQTNNTGFEHPSSTWLRITITEGKYHQVRKMVAAIRHPCMRLVRWSIEDLSIGDLQPGSVKEIPEQEFFGKLKIIPG